MPHLGVRRCVQVRPPEPPVAQQRVHVLVPCDEVVVGRLVVQHGRVLAQVRVDGVGVGDEPEVVGCEPKSHVRHGKGV